MKSDSYLIRQSFKGYCFSSAIVTFSWRVTWNYAYSPFKYYRIQDIFQVFFHWFSRSAAEFPGSDGYRTKKFQAPLLFVSTLKIKKTVLKTRWIKTGTKEKILERKRIFQNMKITIKENSIFLWSNSLSTSLSTNLSVDWPSKVNPTEKSKS